MKKKEKEFEKEFRFSFSAPLVDLYGKKDSTLGDINEILVKQMDFIEKLLQAQLDDIAVKLRFIRANTPISKGLADGREIRNKLKDLIDEIENG